MKKRHFLAFFAVIGTLTALGLLSLRYGWFSPTTALERVEQYGESGGPAFFMDDAPDPDICFARIETWKYVEQVPCALAESRLHPKLGWVKNRLFYFQDARTGLCLASGVVKGYVQYIVIDDCASLDRILGPSDGRWRLDVRLRKH